MLCIYRSKANFAENMANNVKKRVKVPASTPKRKQRMVCLMSEEEVRIVDCYLKKYKITNNLSSLIQPGKFCLRPFLLYRGCNSQKIQ